MAEPAPRRRPTTWDGREHRLGARPSPARERDPRARALGALDGRRARAGAGGAGVRAPPQPGYPFPLALEIEYALADAGLSVRTTATNVGSAPCPYGAGAHPYVTAGTADRRHRRPARAGRLGAALERARHPDRDGAGRGHAVRLPRGRGRSARRASTTLHRARARRRRARARRARGSRRRRGVTLWVDEAYPYLMLFTGDPLPGRRAAAASPSSR